MRRFSVSLGVLSVLAGCVDSAPLRNGSTFELADEGALPAGKVLQGAREVTQWDVDPGPVGEVLCIDQQIAQLGLFDEPATGAITQAPPIRGVFESAIDATAGGLAASQGYVYARFGERGLEKVVIDDESAFDSRTWHIAFRRYVIRLNSGVSGPGTVSAARTAPSTTFAGLTEPPKNLTYRIEQYYTSTCEFVPDTSGIGAPATVLSSFWSYSSCLAMTGNVFVLKLPDDRHVKLEVLAYYSTENQALCDETGTTGSPSGAGNLRVRWAYLD